MPLVFRKLQNTPLSNNQLDGNFEYLRDQLTLKADITALTAAYVAGKLNTPASVGGGVVQTAYQLSQTNALNAWNVRGIEPSITTPVAADKTSLVVRNTDGSIAAPIFTGALNGNATTATNANFAAVAYALDATYKVPVALGGTNATTAAGARDSLKVLSVESDNQMTSRLNLNPSSAVATVAFGVGAVPDNAYNGDMWTTTAGFHYKLNGVNKTFAPIESPTFTGAPQAPAHPNAGTTSSQVSTISHVADAVTTLNASIALKANINSPQFTGIPTCDSTPPRTTNNTRIATTGHVYSVVDYSATQLTTAYQTYTTDAVAALSSTVNGLLALKASLASPALTGTPRSTTPTVNDNSDRIATTAYTVTALAALKSTIDGAISGINDLINQTRPVPTASVFYIATTTVPNGFLEANGSAVSRATYAALWQALGSPNTGNGSTTFNLPDLRGEFIRGWDHGRGLDSSRALNTIQIESMGPHTHDFYDVYAIWGDMPGNYNLVNGVPTYPGGTPAAWYSGLKDVDGQFVEQYFYMSNGSDGDYDGGAYAFKNRTIAGSAGSEVRPRNYSLMPIIKW